MNYREHYITAHKAMFQVKYPEAWRSGFYTPPKFPKVATANGLTNFITNYLTWSGMYANRISSAGRWLANGNKWEGSGQFIPSTTSKGTADIHAIIKGRHVSIEVKIGKDKMSEHQHKEKAKIEAAGGLYWVISHPDELIKNIETL
jgi:hypothetical protein